MGFDRLSLVVVLASIVGCSSGPPEPSGSSSEEATANAVKAGATPAERAHLRDPAVSAGLRDVSGKVAARVGVAAPSTMRAVAASDHRHAETVVSGAVLVEDGPVYVVQMTGGTFTALRRPSQAEAPTGTVLTVTFDAATMRITDVGYDTVAPDLTKIDADVVDLMHP